MILPENSIILGNALSLIKQIPDCSVHMVFTDPPYGHNNNNGDLIHRREAALGRLPCGENPPLARKIENDGPEANEIFRAILPELLRVLVPGGCCCCCCCGGGGPDPQFARWSLWMDEVFDFKQMVVWDKGPMGMGWHYRRSYEVILVGQKPGAACRWFDTTKKIENIIRHIPKIIPAAHEHPTAKPISLAAYFINLHSQPGDVVLDPFAGGGITPLAAKRSGRNFIAFELDPKWHGYAVRRLEEKAGLFDHMGAAVP